MSDIALAINDISKLYRLGAGPAGKGDFREAAAGMLTGLGNRLRGRRPTAAQEAERELWALRDISFEVPRGTVMGLIGHNGAGKSTLLKILSRITDPTAGTAWIDGRVGSLLEVGTGFHPELSGRENIYLNGSILGMTRREISSKFDQIIAFSEIGRFLDTPVKRYSSGMYVRLAFSVAAHLEPEIMVIDEVLAVGDAAFQKKCLDKMKQIASGGRTILFVSHNMGSIQELCDAAIVLQHGKMIGQGSPEQAIKQYLQANAEGAGKDVATRTDRRGKGRVKAVSATAFSQGHEDAPGLAIYGQPLEIRVEVDQLVPDLTCTMAVYDFLHRAVCRFSSRVLTEVDQSVDGKTFRVVIDDLALVPGEYTVNVALNGGSELEDHLESATGFEVQAGVMAGRALQESAGEAWFAPQHVWTVPRGGA